LELEPEAGHGSLIFKLCSDHLSIEAIPRKAVRIDLAGLRGRLISGFELMLWTPQFVVLRNRAGHEVTLRRDGRMIIRKAASEEVAEVTAKEIMTAISGLS